MEILFNKSESSYEDIIISESFRRSRVGSSRKTNRSIDAEFNFCKRDKKRS